jgi:S1-C subfamily serine protease
MMQNRTAVVIMIWLSVLSLDSIAEDSQRVTPTVKLIELVGTAVVPLFVQTSKDAGGSGSGAVIHESGFILTADHVTRNFKGVALFGLERAPFSIVGRCPERDMAILKVPPSFVRSVMPLGRSNDLKAGEPIIVAGNPAGRGIVFSQGIVTSPSIDPSWPNVLVKSYWRNEMQEAQERQQRSTGGRPDFIQFDASSNRGNSGGPLINFDGNIVGIVATKSFIEEGISWAIPADRVRLLLPYMIQPEEMGGFFVGMEMDPLASTAIVQSVVEGSPADNAGLLSGDQIVSMQGQTVASSADWLMLLDGHKPNEQLAIQYQRDGMPHDCTIILAEYPLPVDIDKNEKLTGLSYQFYKGRFAKMPEFKDLQVTKTGTVNAPTSDQIIEPSEIDFAIVFEGFVEFPDSGLYRMELGSDDASRLFLNHRLVIDNDLPHPYQKLSKWVRVAKGLTPFRLEYAETSGEKSLTLEARKDFESEATIPLKFYREQ